MHVPGTVIVGLAFAFVRQGQPVLSSNLSSLPHHIHPNRGCYDAHLTLNTNLSRSFSFILPDYYGLLGVPIGAEQAEIRSAYLRLVRRHHPDVNRAAGAEDFLKRLNRAFELLGNQIQRATNDSRVRRERDEAARWVYEERLRAEPSPPPPFPPQS